MLVFIFVLIFFLVLFLCNKEFLRNFAEVGRVKVLARLFILIYSVFFFVRIAVLEIYLTA